MPKSPKRILALCGSTKSNSTNLRILLYLKRTFTDVLDLHIFENLDRLPFFNPDVQDVSREVAHLRASIEQADGVLISPRNMCLVCRVF